MAIMKEILAQYTKYADDGGRSPVFRIRPARVGEYGTVWGSWILITCDRSKCNFDTDGECMDNNCILHGETHAFSSLHYEFFDEYNNSLSLDEIKRMIDEGAFR